MPGSGAPRLFFPLLLSLPLLHAAAPPPPLVCPGGTALGRFELTVTPPSGGAPRSFQTVNQLLEGDIVTYHASEIDAADKKKVRIALLLIPSQGSKIVVFQPQPADRDATWKVPFRTQLASLVWGMQGLDKSRVVNLVAQDDKLIGELADYAAKTEETQALLEAITQQQALSTGQNLDAAVAGFATQFSPARLNRDASPDQQVATLLHNVNPGLATYDPLAQSPRQQAAQTAGLAAAVAGLFFGANGIGIAATGGEVLVNVHSLVFPHTQFLSALVQTDVAAPNASDDAPPANDAPPIALCGSKPPDASHTEFAFLWAIRFPDVSAPPVGLKADIHLPIGLKSTVPLVVKGADWKLVPRIQNWKLVSDDGATSIPLQVQLNTTAKTIRLDLAGAKLKPGIWRLAGNWDWAPLAVTGSLTLHDFSRFTSSHLTAASHDELTSGSGTLDLQLTGGDFEFVQKVQFEKRNDPFATPEDLQFHLPKEPAGPETSLTIRLDAKPLATGNYNFLIAQSDGKVHQLPFQVLPPPPSLTGTPVVLNTGIDSQTVVLHGSGLDRVDRISADGAQFTLGDPGDGDTRSVAVKLDPGAKPGRLLALQLQVKDFEEPVSIDDAFLIAGPRPAIASVRESVPDSLGISLNPGEMAANSVVSFEVGVLHAPAISELDLACMNSDDSPPMKIKIGDARDPLKLTQESSDTLFLSFLPKTLGPPGCTVMATLITPKSGRSEPRKLGAIVLLPQIDSFRIGDQKAGPASYLADIQGHDLEGITRVGWDPLTGTPVDSIPMPVAGPGNKETLRIAVPWPAPAPHAPLYIWLRGEDRGRLTSAKY